MWKNLRVGEDWGSTKRALLDTRREKNIDENEDFFKESCLWTEISGVKTYIEW